MSLSYEEAQSVIDYANDLILMAFARCLQQNGVKLNIILEELEEKASRVKSRDKSKVGSRDRFLVDVLERKLDALRRISNPDLPSQRSERLN